MTSDGEVNLPWPLRSHHVQLCSHTSPVDLRHSVQVAESVQYLTETAITSNIHLLRDHLHEHLITKPCNMLITLLQEHLRIKPSLPFISGRILLKYKRRCLSTDIPRPSCQNNISPTQISTDQSNH